jgi:dTDP-4-amino-4,6-dideoxygalactose transaminase
MEKIPVFAPAIGVDTLKHVTDALHVGWLGMGAITKEFEDLIAAYLGLQGRYVVATNTGTSAFHLCLRAAGVGPGDEVITPSFNYVADHQAIRMCGAEPVLCDVRDDNLGIDVEKAEALIGPRTKAIDPLHFAGIPCDMDGVYRLAKQHGLRVLEDATHAFGTRYKGHRLGSFGDVTWFSFDPVKIVTSVDGGCVVTGSEEELHRMQRMRLLGVDKDTTERYKNRRAWDYDVVSEGYRYHLTNIMASVDEFIASRQGVCRAYSDAFRGIAGLRVPTTDFTDVSPFIYSLRVLNGRRETMIAHMQARSIDVGIHFLPVHEHTAFRGCRRGDLSVTQKVAHEVLTLPLHSNMKPEFIERVIEGVTSFFHR